MEEGTSGQGFWADRAGTTKARERLSHISEDEDDSTGDEDVPVSATTMGPTKKKKPAMNPKQNVRRQTAPPQLPGLISGVSINNYGSGTVFNRDVGNIKNATISNVGNNNSENYFQPRQKPTNAGYGY